ncbi:MAG: T9SS type A sorting domain-containing protein [Paludibacteraceae bacterium]|nr:T9SS type A sorting domain-containing protein [Paludibacteraceae bacterium]
MKTYNQTKRLLLLCMVAFLSLSSWAIWYDGKQTIIFKSHPANASWWGDGTDADKYAFFTISGSTSGEWAKATYFHGPSGEELFSVTVPQGDWTHMVLTRNKKDETPNFEGGNLFNQTADIPLVDGKDYLTNFTEQGNAFDYSVSGVWSNLLSADINPNDLATTAGITIEEWHLCEDAIGDPLTLQPSIAHLNTAGNDRDWNLYGNNQHAWMKYSDEYPAGSWSLLSASDLYYDKETLGGSAVTFGGGGPVYYYLYDNNTPSIGRMIKVYIDRDCTPTCDITRLEYVVSSVDANRETFVIDGIVAFEATNGNLVLTCEPASGAVAGTVYPTEVYPSIEVVSPHIFKLDGIPADGQQYTLTAYFEGNPSCSKSITFTAPTPKDRLQVIHDTIFTTQSITLEPVSAPTESHGWLHYTDDSSDNLTDLSSTDATYDWKLIVPAPGTAANDGDKLAYIYHEYNPVASPDNLFDNGSFENVTGLGNDKKCSNIPISQYVYWGYDIENYYDDPCKINEENSTTGGFTISRDARWFWRNYSRLFAHDGSNFALIDGKPNDAGAEAWYADTEHNPNLKLKVNTTYLFSFWVANVNNYGEKDNPAILQFRIIYNDGVSVTTKDLGDPINLADYDDKNWHQCTALFEYPSKTDANEVKIIVVDQNGRKLVNGNDFALDDIQFRPVTTYTRTLKIYQERMVHYLKSQMTSVTATPAVINCESTTYDVTVDVTCLHPNGNLVVINKADVPMDATAIADYSQVTPLKTISFTDAEVKQNTPVRKQFVLTLDRTGDNNPQTLVAFFSNYAPGSAAMIEVSNLVDEAEVVKEATFYEPSMPTIDFSPETVIEPACDTDDRRYQLAFDVRYSNQRGGMVVTDEVAGATPVEIARFTEEQLISPVAGVLNGSQTVDVMLPSDGQLHTVTARFETTDCEFDFEYEAPYGQRVKNLQVAVPTDLKCNQAVFDVAISADIQNPHGNFVIELGNGREYKYTYQPAADETHIEHTFAAVPYTTLENMAVPSTAGGNAVSVRAYFEPDPISQFIGCEDETSFVPEQWHNALPTVWDENDNQTFTDPTCGNNLYQIDWVLNFNGQRGDLQIIDQTPNALDATVWDEKVLQTIPFSEHKGTTLDDRDPTAAPVAVGFPIHINLPADGTEHIIEARFAETECSLWIDNFFTTQLPQVTAVEQTQNITDCNTYFDVLHIDYTNAGNYLLQVVDENNNSVLPVDATTAPVEGVDVSSMPNGYDIRVERQFDGATHSYTAYFVGREACSSATSNGYLAKPVPSVVVSNVQATPDAACNAITFTLSADIAVRDARGSLVVAMYNPLQQLTPLITIPEGQYPTSGTISQPGLPLELAGQHLVLFFVDPSAQNNLTVVDPEAERLYDCTLAADYGIDIPRVVVPSLNDLDRADVVLLNTTLACGETEYTVQVTPHFANQSGNMEIVDNDNVVAIIPQRDYENSNGQFTYTLTADGAQHNVYVRFPETGCQTVLLEGAYTAPVILQNVVNAVGNASAPDANGRYTLSIAVQYEHASNGDELTIVLQDKNNPNAQNEVIKRTVDGTGNFTYTDTRLAQGEQYSFSVYFTATPDCKYEGDIDVADGQILTSISEQMTEVACGDAEYQTRITVGYINGYKNIIIREVLSGEQHTLAVTAGNGSVSQDFTFPIDGQQRVFEAWTEGQTEKLTLNGEVAVAKPRVTALELVSSEEVACGGTTYSVTVKATSVNGRGNLVLHPDFDSDVLLAEGHYADEMVFTVPADGTDHSIEAWFADATECEHQTVSLPAQQSKSQITLTQTSLSLEGCESTQYVFEGALTYTNPKGDIEILDENNQVVLTILEGQYSANGATVTINGLADGMQHSFRSQFVGQESCAGAEVTIQPAQASVIQEMQVALTAINENATNGTYDLQVTVPYLNIPAGDRLHIERVDANNAVLASEVVTLNANDNNATATLAGIINNGNNVRVHIWLESRPQCDIYKVYSPTDSRQITSVTAVAGQPSCGDTEYTSVVTVEYTNGYGNIIVRNTATGEQHSLNLSEGSGAATATFTNPLDGNANRYEAWFEGKDDTKRQSADEVVAMLPALTAHAIQAVPAELGCNETTFAVTAKVEYTNARGALVITDENAVELRRFNEGEYGATEQTYTVTFNADGVAHTLIAQFEGFEACGQPAVNVPALMPNPSVVAVSLNNLTYDDCRTSDYTLRLNIDYSNAEGDILLVDENNNIIRIYAQGAGYIGTDGSFDIELTGLADGLPHSVTPMFRGQEACAGAPLNFTPEQVPVLNQPIVAISKINETTGTFDLTLTVPYTNAPAGDKVNVGIMTGQTLTTIAQLSAQGNDNAVFEQAGIPATGETIDLVVWLESRPNCQVPVSVNPGNGQVINAATAELNTIACGDDNYDVTVTVNYTNGYGLLVVEDAADNAVHQAKEIQQGTTSETFTFFGLEIDGKAHHFNVWFADRADKVMPTNEFTPVAVPQVVAHQIDNIPATVGCGNSNYSVSGTVTIKNAVGELRVVDENGNILRRFAETEYTGQQQVAYTIDNLTADGQAHSLTAYFENFDDCAVAAVPFNAPAIPSIANLTATAPQFVACGETQYTLALYFDITNVVAGQMLMLTDGQGVESSYIVSPTEVANGYVTLNYIGEPADGKTYTAAVELDDCEITAEYTSPVAPTMQEPVITAVTELACGQTTVGVPFSVTSANQIGNFVVLDASDNNRVVFGPVTAADLIEGTTEPLTAGIAHWLVFRFDGAHSCESDPIKVELPKITRIEATQLTAVASGVANSVNATTVSVDVTAVFDYNQTLADLVITADGAEALTVQNPESGKVYTITLPADGKEHTIGASLGNCEYDEVKVLVGATPTIGALTAVAEALNNDCNVHTNIINFSVEFSGLAGDLVLADNGTEVLTIANPVSGQMYEYDMPLDGQSHTFTAKIADGETNAVQIVAPVQPTLLSFTVNAQTDAIACGETAYNATGVLTVQNIYGDYRITDEATGEEVLTGTIPQGAVTIADFNFSLAHTVDNAEHSFLLTLTNTGCAIKSNSFVEPALTICNVYSDTICQTEQYAENGFNVTAPEVGMNKLVNGNDTLYLFVEAVPVAEIGTIEATCASEGSVVSVPFEITQGTPATYSIIFKDARFEPIEGKLPSNGEFAITVPEGVEGGQFEAELHLYSEYGHCESVAQTFTFNLSHDNLVYSKWNDVLFIDNHEDKFVSYQWYENGKALEGETEQRLYKPEDGMTGSYYCVMTTTDGATVQTCEYLFSDAPRSADVVAERYHKVTPTHLAPGQTLTIERSETTNADIIVYDPTGRQVSRVYTESEKTEIKVPSVVGVYMIRLTDRENGDSWTEKIIVK